MIKKLYQGIVLFIATKLLFWIKPESKTVLRNLAICVFFIFLIIYSHTEYINWSEISGNTQYITLSFILKNALIAVSIIILIFSIRKSKLKNDGFDKYRNRTLETASQKKLKPQEPYAKNEINDAYFDKFRKKEKLRTTQEIKLGKK